MKTNAAAAPAPALVTNAVAEALQRLRAARIEGEARAAAPCPDHLLVGHLLGAGAEEVAAQERRRAAATVADHVGGALRAAASTATADVAVAVLAAALREGILPEGVNPAMGAQWGRGPWGAGMPRVLASADPAALAAVAPTVTVEAEYGDAVVEGSALTMAHHGPRAGQKCPAAYHRDEVVLALAEAGVVEAPTVGVSHVDLDTVGGYMAVVAACYRHHKPSDSPLAKAFWALAEWVDVRGPHRLAECPDATPEAVACLRAYWAWAVQNRGPRIGVEVIDVTSTLEEHAATVRLLLQRPNPWAYFEDSPDYAGELADWDRREALLAAGQEFADKEDALRVSSFRAQVGPVVLREHDGFTNHLYAPMPGACVVAFNGATGAVTVSFADGAESPLSARDLVQELWGPLAGGHHGIAGSPRGATMTWADALGAFDAVLDWLGLRPEPGQLSTTTKLEVATAIAFINPNTADFDDAGDVGAAALARVADDGTVRYVTGRMGGTAWWVLTRLGEDYRGQMTTVADVTIRFADGHAVRGKAYATN